MARPMASGIVTPEAVVLQMDTAGIGSRLVARIIDALLQLVLAVALLVAAQLVASNVPKVGVAGVFLALFVVLFGYPVGFETLWRGRTPGKAMLGLRVVTVEGAPIRFRHAAVRAVLALVEVYLLYGAPALITMGLSRRDQRLGDMAAGTVVLRERAAKGALAPATFVVPGYEQYVASMDVSRVTPQDYAAARSFLLRAASLAPEHRADLAWRLAQPLAGRLGQQPPPWVGPEPFLACLAAAYQERSRRAAVGPLVPGVGPTGPVPGQGGGPGPTPALVPRTESAPSADKSAARVAPPVTGFVPPA